MGALQRFERRLEGLVEGAFARVFKGVVEPVEIASALQKEASDRRAILGPGRILVPNDYTVELGQSDYARLSPYAEPLGRELGAMLQERAQTQGWHFVGPVRVRFEEDAALRTGVFHVYGDVDAAAQAHVRAPQRPVPAVGRRGTPRLLVPADAHPSARNARAVPLDRLVTLIGRAADADVRLSDTGVSRHHAELRVEGDDVVVVDAGSTNGTEVNGQRVQRARLADGDQITVGTTVLTFSRDEP